VSRLWLLVAAAAVVGLGTDVATGATYPGLTALTGFVGCAALVVASKWLGTALLKRPEAYYADPVVEEDLGDAG
jgi:hypothetical protein